MSDASALKIDAISPDSDSGVRRRSDVHPLLLAIEAAPLEPISDEEAAELDEIVRTTTKWLTTEEFLAATGIGPIP